MRLPIVVQVGGDTAAIAGVAASLVGYAPPAAGLVAIIWYVIQIYESQTLQSMLKAYRLRRLVRLRAEAVALELLIREKSGGTRGLDKANAIQAAATAEAQRVQQVQDRAKEEAPH